MKTDDPRVQEGWRQACEGYQRAYAPYSKFQVGAALAVKGQQTWTVGCNVENASFGATVCAERVAFWNARATYGAEFQPDFLVLVTDTEPPVAPCALCLQVFSEFCSSDFPIFLANLKGVSEKVLFKDLLGRPFDKAQLDE
jgi:cytidine deaminase